MPTYDDAEQEMEAAAVAFFSRWVQRLHNLNPADPAFPTQAVDLWDDEVEGFLAAVVALFTLRWIAAGAPGNAVSGPRTLFREQSRLFLERSRDLVITEIQTKYRLGMKPPELGPRAQVVGRTFNMIAWNRGEADGDQYEQRLGRKKRRKRWETVSDLRVRDTHRPLHGVTIPADAYFTVGGYPALYPGDFTLPPAESVNCRCRAVYLD